MVNKKSNKTMRTAATRTNRNAMRSRSNTCGDMERRKYMAIIAVLAVALIGMAGVAVAAFSTDLKINGMATVKSTVWDIHFDNLKPVEKTGSDKIKEITAPTIQEDESGNKSTAIKEFAVELKEPGDTIEYTFDVKNEGDLDAKITAITMSSDVDSRQITCTTAYAAGDDDEGKEEESVKAARERKVCDNIEYTLKYSDGTDVAVGDKLAKQETSSTANVKTMKLKLKLKDTLDADDLPDKDVKITGLGITITYGQDKSN